MPRSCSRRELAPNAADPDLAALIRQRLMSEQRHPLEFRKLNVELARCLESHRESRARQTLAEMVVAGEVLDLGGDTLFLAANLDRVEARIEEILQARHEASPFDPAMPTGEIKRRFSKTKTRNARRNIDPRLFDLGMSRCKDRGTVVETDRGVCLANFEPSEAQRRRMLEIEEAAVALVEARAYQRLEVESFMQELGIDRKVADVLLERLLASGRLYAFAESRFLSVDTLRAVERRLSQALSMGGALTTGELKDLLAAPRNALIPLLEWLDGRGFTEREGDRRRLAS
ncbi:MAG: SelB C-terminal domain-containing protein [Candidatus Krumholzibacteriia bacterium]